MIVDFKEILAGNEIKYPDPQLVQVRRQRIDPNSPLTIQRTEGGVLSITSDGWFVYIRHNELLNDDWRDDFDIYFDNGDCYGLHFFNVDSKLQWKLWKWDGYLWHLVDNSLTIN